MATVKKLNETTYEVTVVKTGDEVKHLKENLMTHFNVAKLDCFRQ